MCGDLFVFALRRCFGIALVLVFALAQVTSARAGTTGGVTGRVIDAQTRMPLAGAKVTAASPSGSASATTNAQGAYALLSLAPDTYVLTVEIAGYRTAIQQGVTIQADQTQTLPLAVAKLLQTIGRTTSRSSTDLVKPGTTSDVYSIGTATAGAAQALGGPGGVDQAYSALALVPGVYVPQGQQGWYQPIYIRGGDQDQIGYELDGIPANRSYDNAPMSLLSNIGQQELQVYTGGATASSDGQGISGYINSVVKTGTTPGFASFDYGLGGPTGYQKGSFEIGGVSGRLSYYAGAAVVNQNYRFYDQFNGASQNNNGYFTPSYGYLPATYNAANNGDLPGYYGGAATTEDRENVLNLHYSLPHASGNGKDDLQFLYLTQELYTQSYSSYDDIGGAPAFDGVTLNYADQYVYSGTIGGPLQNGATRQYLFPNTPDTNRAFQSTIGADQRDVADNGYSVEKLQYQHNMGSTAYVRFAAYGSYSNWFIHDPLADPFTLDYILPNHTFGYNALFADQLTDKHLLTVSGSITSTHESRYYNTGDFLGGNGAPNSLDPGSGDYAVLAGSYTDKSGHCYSQTTGAYASCFDPSSQATFDAYSGVFNPYTKAPAGTSAAINGASWIATENGTSGNLNQVDPILFATSVSDQWHPTDRLTVNAGVRIEKYLDRFVDEADGYPTRQFWVNAYNREYCSGPGLGAPVDVGVNPLTGAGNPCPTGTSPVAFSLQAPNSESNSVFEPRVGATYNLSPDSVVRASYGTYARPPNASWVQYGVTQEDLASYAIPKFYSEYGFTTPVHDLRPDTSHNFDLSYEAHLHGTDMSYKISPYYRGTMDQFENIFLNSNGAESGVNIGRERTFGVEAAFTKGSFARDGFAAQLSFTYDYSRFRYSDFASGNNVIDIINESVKNYNAYTSACAATSGKGICGTTSSGALASPCYSPTGTAVSCATAGAVVNPYYNAAPQPLFDRNAEYMPYDAIPDQPFLGGNGFGAPEVATLLLNYKNKKYNISPSITFTSGSDYGSPLSTPGIDPTSAGSSIIVPDQYTGKFDNMGAFSQPWRYTVSTQLGYQMTPKLRATLTLTGLVDNCIQRGYVWDRAGFCAYSTLPFGAAPSSPTEPSTDPNLKYPYSAQQGNNNTTFVGVKIPFELYFNLQYRI
jgi:outer membrane receptor protein involved in Fe transport